MDTSVLVDSGTYRIVRYPQVLNTMLLISTSMLISEHWLAAIVGVPMVLSGYQEAVKEEKGLMVKFGDDHKRFMQKVPKTNLLSRSYTCYVERNKR